MGFSNRHLFNSRINEENAYDIKKKLDYKEQKLENRKRIVNDLLENKDSNQLNFFENYFDNFYKPELNQCDALSEDNNVCKTLEQMADYILGSEEIRDERKDSNSQYRFFVDRNEYNRVRKKEESLDAKCTIAEGKSGVENGSDSVINFLVKKTNSYKPKKQTINAADLEKNNFCGKVLRDYKEYDNLLTEKLKNPTNGEGYKLRKIKGEINLDMIYTKDTLNGVFGYHPKNLLIGQTLPSWELFDWSDIKQVRALMYMQKEFDPNDDLSLMVYDLDLLVRKGIRDRRLTALEIRFYDLVKKGYKNIEIAKELGCNRQRISNLGYAVANKICKLAKEMGY